MFLIAFRKAGIACRSRIRKLLHEISRIAEQALDRARKVKEEGTHAVQSAIERLNRLEQDVSALVVIAFAQFRHVTRKATRLSDSEAKGPEPMPSASAQRDPSSEYLSCIGA